MSLAKKRRIPLPEVEQEIFSATHADTGAYLLALWGLPSATVEAVALHHTPARSRHKKFSPLTAVHVANVFEHELNPDRQGPPANEIDEQYLASLDLRSSLDEWRFKFVGVRRPTDEEVPEAETASPVRKPFRFPAFSFKLRRWMPAIAGTGAALCVVVFWMTHELNEAAKFSAARPQTHHALAVAEAESVPQAIRNDALPSENGFQVPKANEPEPAGLASANPDRSPEQNTARRPAIPAELFAPAQDGAFPNLSLQGVFYRKSNSVAIINGRTVREGDEIDGARVLSIGRETVQVGFDGEARTLVAKTAPKP
jgi:hypothetical protein